MTKKEIEVEGVLKSIYGLTQYEELYLDGIHHDIRNLCIAALNILKGKRRAK